MGCRRHFAEPDRTAACCVRLSPDLLFRSGEAGPALGTSTLHAPLRCYGAPGNGYTLLLPRERPFFRRDRGSRDGQRHGPVRRGRAQHLETARFGDRSLRWDVQVGMRSTILDDAKEDRAQFNRLLQDADVFFANKRPGFLKKHGLDAESLCEQKPGLIHAIVAMHGEKGPWSNRPGFDEIGAAVSGLFTIEGSPTRPKQPPIVPIADNVVGWLGTTGILAALRRRAIEGGSYRVVVSLTRTVLWLLSLGIFDKAYAKATAGSTDEHKYIAPDLFTAETPLGTYQGMTDQIVLSRTPGAYRTVLVPRGSSKPEWLPNGK